MSLGEGVPWYRQVVYLSLPWLVVGLGLEVATRVFYDAPHSGRRMFKEFTMSEPHPRRIWKYKANYLQKYQTDEFAMEVATNSWGLRDAEPDPSATLRVLAIGDSFTFGWGVAMEARYSNLLEESLQRLRPDERVEVLNAGHFNYSFDQQLIVLGELIEKYRPQVVLQGVYPGHVFSIREHAWQLGDDGALLKVSYADRTNAVRVTPDGVLKRTNLWIEEPPLGSRFIAKLLQRYFRSQQIEEAVAGALWLYEPGNSEMAEAWSLTEDAILRASAVSRAHGAMHVVFDVPQDVQVSEAEWLPHFREGAAKRELDMDHPTRVFESAAGNAKWVSLLEVFRDSYRPSLYYPRDPHWTAEGHRLAADALLPAVADAIEGVLIQGSISDGHALQLD